MISRFCVPRSDAESQDGDAKALGAASTLHRLTSQYGPLSAIVPIAGLAVFLTNLDAFGSEGRFHASVALTLVAWIILIALIIPRQKKNGLLLLLNPAARMLTLRKAEEAAVHVRRYLQPAVDHHRNPDVHLI